MKIYRNPIKLLQKFKRFIYNTNNLSGLEEPLSIKGKEVINMAEEKAGTAAPDTDEKKEEEKPASPGPEKEKDEEKGKEGDGA